MTSVADAVLDLHPDSTLAFTLSEAEQTPTCTLDLRHPDESSPPIAFKVKTTQPRRYLVRPNQGLIEPGQTQRVQILIVEKEKQTLVQSFQRLGQSALDNSKDKFLVQSVAVVDPARAKQLKDYEQLTSLWATVGSAPSSETSAVANKKLHVRLQVVGMRGPGVGAAAANRSEVTKMTKEQLQAELGPLRKKYDELVAFSVNLTAERDMLNNSWEQTKRDLERYVKKGDKRGTVTPSGSGTSSLFVFCALLITLVLGVKIQQMGLVSKIPVLSDYLLGSGENEEL